MNSGPCISLPHLNIGAVCIILLCVLTTTRPPQPWLRTLDCVVVALPGRRLLLGKKVERGGAASAAGVEFIEGHQSVFQLTALAVGSTVVLLHMTCFRVPFCIRLSSRLRVFGMDGCAWIHDQL